jgi:hypothetical protein
MRTNIRAAWLTPTSIEARLFANRDKERERLEEILEDLFESHTRRYRVVVFGDRGIGKSILTSVASENFAKRHPERVLRVEVNGRSIGFRQFLKALAGGLVESAKPLLPSLGEKKQMLERWLDELALFAKNDQLSEGQLNTLTTKYGIGAQVGGSLFEVLKGSNSFSWEQSRQLSGSSNRTQTVTDDLLHEAIKATLRKIHDETHLLVVVFFDDLDQAYTDDVHAMKPALKRILDVDPCVGLVHMRTEMLFDDLRREMDDSITVGPLEEHGLLAIIERRLDAAMKEDRARFSKIDVQSALRRLTRATGNPLVFLRWVSAFLRTGHWPPQSDTSWCTDAVLREVAVKASIVAGIEDEFLERLAFIVDRCLPGGRKEVQKQDLFTGHLKVAACNDGKKITQDELDLLVRTGLLIPMDRFREEAGYRMDPVLDLLRPSVAERLREP